MGRVKTAFIDKEKAVTYKLIPTESSCSVTGEPKSGDTSVLVKSKSKTDASGINDLHEGSKEPLAATKRIELLGLGFIDDGYDYTQHLRTMRQSSDDSRNSIASFVRGNSVSTSETSLERHKKVSIDDLDDLMIKMNEVEVSEKIDNFDNYIGDDFFIEAMKNTDQEKLSKMEPSQKRSTEKKVKKKAPYIRGSTPSSNVASNFEHIFALYGTKNRDSHRVPQLHGDIELPSILKKKIDILESGEEVKWQYEIIENSRPNCLDCPANDVEFVNKSEQRLRKCYEVNNQVRLTSKNDKNDDFTDEIGLHNVPEILADGRDDLKKEKGLKFEDGKEVHYAAANSPASVSEVNSIEEMQSEIWRTDIGRKGETPEEKKIRKLRVKAGRRDARAAKKELKHAFKSAKKMK